MNPTAHKTDLQFPTDIDLDGTRPLLEVRNLRTSFFGRGEEVRAVDDVSFSLKTGETLGLVGESGCGKSVTALSILRLVPEPQGKILGGEVWLDGVDLLSLPDEGIRAVRGSQIGMIFQEPMTSLNPVLSIGRQLTETLEIHLGMTKHAAKDRAAELLNMVGIPDATSRLLDYPHQLSGGQRQRVMIAIALSCDPKLIIADEATTALDVTIQAQILELLARLTDDLGTALMIITHNLGVVARYADRVNVMYAGKIRESGSADEIYDTPRHPYTVGLLDSVPRLDRPKGSRLKSIEGEIPDLANLPTGCAYRPRCTYAVDRCAAENPPLAKVGDSHASACWEWPRLAEEQGQTVVS
jgi:oligopeptide transport system ATP-binding protein